MKRRSFLLTSGSAFLSGTAISGLQKPSFALEFELSTIPNRDPKNLNSVLIKFDKFNLTPRYVDSSKYATVNINLTIGNYSKSISKTVSVNNDDPVVSNDLKPEIPVILDNIDTTKNSIDCEIVISINHDSIGTKTYNQTFTITDNPLLNGLVSYYPIEKGDGRILHDGSGSNIGQINGSNWTSGKIGQNSLEFDGSDDYVRINYNVVSDVNGGGTMSAWFYADNNNGTSTGEDAPTVVGSLNRPAMLTYGNGQLHAVTYDGSYTNINSNVSKENWHHAVWRLKSNGTIELFVDGISQGTKTTGSLTNSDGRDTSIGAHNGRGNWFDGRIDEVRIYNRALSDSEVEDLYNITEPSGAKITENDIPSNNNGGVARYKFENDVTDSWNNNDGTDNTSSTYVDGVYGQSKDFGGNGDIDIPKLSSLDKFTVSLWFNADNDTYIRMLQLFNNNGIIFEVDGNQDAQFRIDDSTSNTVLTEPINVNTWYHFVGTWDGLTMRHYINGNKTGEATQSSNVSQNGADVIGSTGSGTRLFKGQIDDLRIYNKQLTESEVQQLFKLGSYKIQ